MDSLFCSHVWTPMKARWCISGGSWSKWRISNSKTQQSSLMSPFTIVSLSFYHRKLPKVTRAPTWGRFWGRSAPARWFLWIAGASRWYPMTPRRPETPCPTRSSTTTFLLEWWVTATRGAVDHGAALIGFKLRGVAPLIIIQLSLVCRMPPSPTASTPWERNTPRGSTAGEGADEPDNQKFALAVFSLSYIFYYPTPLPPFSEWKTSFGILSLPHPRPSLPRAKGWGTASP